MENETLPAHGGATDRPDQIVASFPARGSAMDVSHGVGSTDRTGVFQQLVTEDGDISGLVAYSIYKQNKLDWLQAFETAKGRAPNEGELSAYIIGESTPRRLATYRHLAESTLAGRGPDIGGVPSRHAIGSSIGHGTAYFAPRLVATYAFIALACLVAFYFAARYTVATH